MKTIYLKLIFSTLLVQLTFAQVEKKDDSFLDYALLFKNHFSPYFKIKRKDGAVVQISENDPVWKYVAEAFLKKTPNGTICWLNRNPDGVGKSAMGQCYLARTGYIEIRLSHKFDNGEIAVEQFWKTLIFEICNAEQAGNFLDLMQKLSSGKITRSEFSDSSMRFEFSSAVRSKEFQKNIWRPFCKNNNIECSNIDWFFPEGATFQQWVDMLKMTERGREYLNTYFDSEKVP